MSNPSDSVTIAVIPDTPAQETLARELANRLHLPFEIEWIDGFDVFLRVTDARLELLDAHHPKQGSVYVDFLSGALNHRRKHGGGSSPKQPIARAVGLPGKKPIVLDATAGLGRDAFILACVGCAVTAVERSEIIYELLRDGLQRAAESNDLSDGMLDRLHPIHADAVQYMRSLPDASLPDVVYIDPMYPADSGASALVKKEMRVLRRLLGDAGDSLDLFEAAMQCATDRVVVKRPASGPPIAGAPTASFGGKTTRFDMYLTGRHR